MDYYSENTTDRGGCGGPVIMACVLLLFLLCSCKQIEYIPVIEHHTDTTYIVNHERDSIWLHDSILIKERGDSFLIEKWHTKYIEKVKIDTLYKAVRDTIPQPYPVEKELTLWQRAKQTYGGYAMLAVLAGLVVLIFRIKGKFGL